MSAIPWWKEPTRAQWSSFLAAWAGWVLDAFDFTIFLLVMPILGKEFGVSVSATAGSITLTLLFRLLGGMAAGSLADRVGRKLPLMLSIIWFALCDGAVYFAPTFGWILALRTLFGFGMGAEWTSGATLAMENWPARSRGIISGILQGSWALGYLLAAQAFGWIVPQWGWRPLFLVAALPALLVLPIRFFVPESAEWRETVARRKGGGEQRPRIFSLMGDLVWAAMVMASGFSVYYGMSGLYPTLLAKELGRSTSEIATLVSWFNVGMLIGAGSLGLLAVRRGLRTAAIIPPLLLLPSLPLYVGAAPQLLGVGAFLGGAFGAGICGLIPVLLTGLFPPSVRARCVGVVYHVGAVVAAFVPLGIAEVSRADQPLSRVIAVATACFGLAFSTLFILRRRPLTYRVDEPEVASEAATEPGSAVAQRG